MDKFVHLYLCVYKYNQWYAADLLLEVQLWGQNWLQVPSLFHECCAAHSSGLPQKPLFQFLLLVTLLLFRIQNLIGGCHALKSFPHACSIFIKMCEQGQGSSWAQRPSVHFILDELSVSERHCGSSQEEHMQMASQPTWKMQTDKANKWQLQHW